MNKLEKTKKKVTIKELKVKRLSVSDLHNIWYKATNEEISLTIDKGLKAIHNELYKEEK